VDYEVTLSPEKSFITIKYLGPMTTELAMESGPTMLALAKTHDVNKFLFDMTASRNVQTVTKNYAFAYKDIQSFEFPRASRSAFLVNPEDHSHDFITTAFSNAGYMVKIFFEYPEAVAWLNGLSKK